ncbi:hypothetical protein KIPB_002343 [Kipferlia bialata]|uniref:FYVE-type domain-containing protein n=1 Tax=Kipferlia bialata TaxID=797122 RepID=A0A9K3CQ45_9EUKA|nr:hypothetical protein KIPB_002343 [Kipferlia bialata]|eukprot:g2343.t1
MAAWSGDASPQWPLIEAALGQHRDEMLRGIIADAEDPLQLRDPEGSTILHAVVLQEREDLVSMIVNCIIATGVPPPVEYETGGTEGGEPTYAPSSIARADVVDAVNAYGETPLHYAADAALPGLIDALLMTGADANKLTAAGHSPLHLAALRGDLDCVHALFEAGGLITPQDEHGFTPAHFAALKADHVLLREMCQRDLCAVASESTQRGHTVLHLLAVGDSELLVQSADQSLDYETGQNETPEAYLRCLQVLLTCLGEDLDAGYFDNIQHAFGQDIYGRSPMHYFALGSVPSLELILAFLLTVFETLNDLVAVSDHPSPENQPAPDESELIRLPGDAEVEEGAEGEGESGKGKEKEEGPSTHSNVAISCAFGDHSAPIQFFCPPDQYGLTPLLLSALLAPDPSLTKLLLPFDNVLAVSEYFGSVLHCAVYSSSVELLTEVCDALISGQFTGTLAAPVTAVLALTDKLHRTPLHIAASQLSSLSLPPRITPDGSSCAGNIAEFPALLGLRGDTVMPAWQPTSLPLPWVPLVDYARCACIDRQAKGEETRPPSDVCLEPLVRMINSCGTADVRVIVGWIDATGNTPLSYLCQARRPIAETARSVEMLAAAGHLSAQLGVFAKIPLLQEIQGPLRHLQMDGPSLSGILDSYHLRVLAECVDKHSLSEQALEDGWASFSGYSSYASGLSCVPSSTVMHVVQAQPITEEEEEEEAEGEGEGEGEGDAQPNEETAALASKLASSLSIATYSAVRRQRNKPKVMQSDPDQQVLGMRRTTLLPHLAILAARNGLSDVVRMLMETISTTYFPTLRDSFRHVEYDTLAKVTGLSQGSGTSLAFAELEALVLKYARGQLRRACAYAAASGFDRRTLALLGETKLTDDLLRRRTFAEECGILAGCRYYSELYTRCKEVQSQRSIRWLCGSEVEIGDDTHNALFDSPNSVIRPFHCLPAAFVSIICHPEPRVRVPLIHVLALDCGSAEAQSYGDGQSRPSDKAQGKEREGTDSAQGSLDRQMQGVSDSLSNLLHSPSPRQSRRGSLSLSPQMSVAEALRAEMAERDKERASDLSFSPTSASSAVITPPDVISLLADTFSGGEVGMEAGASVARRRTLGEGTSARDSDGNVPYHYLPCTRDTHTQVLRCVPSSYSRYSVDDIAGHGNGDSRHDSDTAIPFPVASLILPLVNWVGDQDARECERATQSCGCPTPCHTQCVTKAGGWGETPEERRALIPRRCAVDSVFELSLLPLLLRFGLAADDLDIYDTFSDEDSDAFEIEDAVKEAGRLLDAARVWLIALLRHVDSVTMETKCKTKTHGALGDAVPEDKEAVRGLLKDKEAVRGLLSLLRLGSAITGAVGASNEFGLTPLHVAALTGSPTVFAALLAAGADPDATDGAGVPPVAYLAAICVAGVVGVTEGEGEGNEGAECSEDEMEADSRAITGPALVKLVLLYAAGCERLVKVGHQLYPVPSLFPPDIARFVSVLDLSAVSGGASACQLLREPVVPDTPASPLSASPVPFTPAPYLRGITSAMDDVMGRVDSLLDRDTATLQGMGGRGKGVTREQVGLRPQWEINANMLVCPECGVAFGKFLNRRHHCRACGRVLCSKCCSHVVDLPDLGYTRVKVCEQCLHEHKGRRR